MELRLLRTSYRPTVTLGRLYLDEVFECWTLEDAMVGGPKIDGETAIPVGRYQVKITPSQRASQRALWSPHPPYLPELLHVPGFTGIRIHAGNRPVDTAGCILVGQGLTDEGVLVRSRPALDALMQKLEAALAKDTVFLTIE